VALFLPTSRTLYFLLLFGGCSGLVLPTAMLGGRFWGHVEVAQGTTKLPNGGENRSVFCISREARAQMPILILPPQGGWVGVNRPQGVRVATVGPGGSLVFPAKGRLLTGRSARYSTRNQQHNKPTTDPKSWKRTKKPIKLEFQI